jgi:hypothetical protein
LTLSHSLNSYSFVYNLPEKISTVFTVSPSSVSHTAVAGNWFYISSETSRPILISGC